MRKILILNITIFLFVSSLEAQNKIQTPELEKVTVINEQGHVEINWFYNELDSIDGFIVYYLDPTKTPAPSIPFATITDSSATSYIDISGLANDSSIAYTISAFKEGDTSLLSDPHFTIFLEEDWEECDTLIKLNWNRYIGWEDSLTWYRIIVNNSRKYSTQDTSYEVEIKINTNYQFVIEAIETDSKLTSNSNIVLQETVFPEPTDFINADYATVNGESIFLSFTLGEHGEEYDYLLLAKPPGSNTFSDSLATFSYSEQLDYNFLTGNVSEQYQFKIQEINRCGRTIKESNISSNIVLEGEEDESVVQLNWTNYFDWLAGVETYTVYRDVGYGFEEIYTISGLRYQDDINAFIADKQIASISYYIEATEGVGNPYLSQPQMSSSNIITIYLESKLEFPTAFTPNADGMNDIFRPIDLYFIPTDYHLVVFDRWGKKVFETKQVEEGWDGKFNSGKNVLEGVYNYHVQYKNPEGVEISQTGIVTVIYP